MEKRNFRQGFLNIFLIVLTVLLLSFLVNPNNANAQKVLKIGGVFEMSGPTSSMGYPESEGLKLAVSEINAEGGVKIAGETYKLELLLFDTRANPSEAVGIAEKLITREGVKAIFSGAHSGTNTAMVTYTQPAKVLHLCVGCTAFIKVLGKPGNEYLFKASSYEGGERGTAAHFLPFLVKKNNVKTAVIMVPATEAGRIYSEVDKTFLEDGGVKVLEVILFNPTLKDFYPQLSKVKLANPDMFGVGFTDDEVIPILRQSVEIGIKSKLVGLGAGMSEKAAYVMGEDKPPAEGYTWIAYFPPLTDPKTIDFCGRYQKFYNKKCQSDVGFAIMMYETLEHVLWAMQKVGSTTDTAKIANAIKGHRFDTGLVVKEYDQTGLATTNYWIAEIKNGKIVWDYIPLKK
jgi:branched-chain amino acid transport system substrate-binding protein